MKIFVAGSMTQNESIRDDFNESAEYIGNYLSAEKDIGLVFGGSINGPVGKLYQEIKKKKTIEGNEIVVVTSPEFVGDLKHINADKVIHEKRLSARVDRLIDESDIILVLPGGKGTLHELIQAIETKGSEHNKPIIVLNEQYYYDDFLSQLEKNYIEGHSKPRDENFLHVLSNATEVSMLLYAYFDAMRKRGKHYMKDKNCNIFCQQLGLFRLILLPINMDVSMKNP